MTDKKSREKNPRKSELVDTNAAVKVGAVVDAYFTLKKEHFMVVAFDYEGQECTGVLHVSQFPHKNRKKRDAMFELAEVGPQLYRLTVIEVVPPSGKFKLTVVRLTARDDFDPEIFAKSSIAGSYRGQKTK